MAFDRDLDDAYASESLFSAASRCCFCFLLTANDLADRAVKSSLSTKNVNFSSTVSDISEASDFDRVVVNPAHGFDICDVSASCLRRLLCTWLNMADRSPALLLDRIRDVCVLLTKSSELSITSRVSSGRPVSQTIIRPTLASSKHDR